MLPVGQGSGQIWRRNQLLCDVEYDIGESRIFSGGVPVQRISFTLLEEDYAPLLDAYDLSLVIADGRRYAIPRPLQLVGVEHLECYVGSLA